MGDLVLGERWNTEDSLEMALGIREAVESLIRKREPQDRCLKQLEKGVKFLEEAKGGEAIISGAAEEADSFNGTFVPICLATDVCIKIKNGTPDTDEGAKRVGALISKYKDALEKMKERGLKSKIPETTLKEIASFFKALCALLLEEADPVMKDYSRPDRYAGTYI